MNIYLQIFGTFARIGAFTIGGGYAMIPIIQKEVVEKKGWIKEQDFLDVLAIVANGLGTLSFWILIRYILSAAAAYCGTMLGIKLMRNLASGKGYTLFGVYCWGLALFTFILNLIA